MGFLKLVNEHTLDWLLKKYPNAFLLLTLIAKRAKRVDDDTTGLKKCQAFIGDYKECGLTEQKYRTAKKVLESNGLITTQATNKGTIATLLDTRVYDINAEDDNEQKNTTQRSNNEQITTNKKLRSKKEEIKKEDNKLLFRDLVYLTEDEYHKLVDKFGHAGADDRIENLNLYGLSKPKLFNQYASHYATILTWDRKNNTKSNTKTDDQQLPVFGDLKSMMERDGIKK